ncbi:sporulation peptidase YabG [Desulforamulus hydrothermalis]|uniref:Sporulation-specific protease yabG n=1 Tax=Desulforamulus hydrothermalis Lam5 = DSM 18033 TaxID=1121428 RepID=K8EIZ9_9FIRM|nr:sporulation peptidase YabG [Desulforamulus hydrothermalis]CCO08581.1 Sporulation-specific protease yabG [Desulforamulus hydrothermalis Lam5 = DSM 18033]SHH01754.1 spore coat assemly protein [Desulforamulus hydrothermalis Lam5 = DSM 18033]
MSKIQEGDIVARKSYGNDVFFKVTGIFRGDDGKDYAVLKGLDIRLFASSLVDDLIKIDPKDVAQYWTKTLKNNAEVMDRVMKRRLAERKHRLQRCTDGLCLAGRSKDSDRTGGSEIEGFDVPGSVLHLDGDKDYLDLCMTTYRNLSIPAFGYAVEEKEQPKKVLALLEKHYPDILVLTGHDGIKKGAKDYKDVNNYHNSKYFIEAVKIARSFEKSRDDLVIFAGACQSCYEAILSAGANFASSPKRVLIHAFDPVFVVEKISYTSIHDPIAIRDIIKSTITGFDGIGGIETRGKHRLGVPRTEF